MNEQAKEKIERTRKYVLASALPEDTKDGLGNLLDAGACAANGTPDKLQAIADAILELILHEVKQAVRNPEAVKKAVQEHVKECPLAAAPGGKLGVVYRFRWPLCVIVCTAVFSPNFSALAGLVERIWK